jgi:hypothetical protein
LKESRGLRAYVAPQLYCRRILLYIRQLDHRVRCRPCFPLSAKNEKSRGFEAGQISRAGPKTRVVTSDQPLPAKAKDERVWRRGQNRSCGGIWLREDVCGQQMTSWPGSSLPEYSLLTLSLRVSPLVTISHTASGGAEWNKWRRR